MVVFGRKVFLQKNLQLCSASVMNIASPFMRVRV
jgi:hypothetical protein